MALTNKSLIQGSVSTKTDVLTASGKTYLVHYLSLFNPNSSASTIKLYRYNGSNEYQFYEMFLAGKETADLILQHEGIILETTHKLAIESTLTINYSIDGTEDT